MNEQQILVYPDSPSWGIIPQHTSAADTQVPLILKINGSSTEGKTITECLGLMRGPIGTKVQLEVMDSESKVTKTVELTKQKFLTAVADFRD